MDGGRRRALLLLPLRVFLGVTFVYAGLQKFADPHFLAASSPSSMHAQLTGVAHGTPLSSLARALAPHAGLVGVAVALGELAVGLGTLAGLLVPVAAVGGLLLSLGFWLTVSWHSRPYYYGPDIVFVFAWTTLVLAPVPLPFSLDAALRRSVRQGGTDDVARREVLRKLVVAGYGFGAAAIVGGATAGVGRLLGGAPSSGATHELAAGRAPHPTSSTPSTPTTPAPTPSTSAPSDPGPAPARPPGILLGAASAVPVGGAARFRDPVTGDPAIVVHPGSDRWTALSAVCTHAGCTVRVASAGVLACPCHGAEFSTADGQVLRGPARRALAAIPVTEGGDGNLYRVQ